MRTPEEVKAEFTPNPKLNDVEKTILLKTEMLFTETALEVFHLVPDGPHKTAALRKLLESKMTCVHAITHGSSKGVQAQAPAPAQVTETKNVKKQETKKQAG